MIPSQALARKRYECCRVPSTSSDGPLSVWTLTDAYCCHRVHDTTQEDLLSDPCATMLLAAKIPSASTFISIADLLYRLHDDFYFVNDVYA